MTFENGWTVSVQFGLMNYCTRKVRSSDPDPIDWSAPMRDYFWESSTAEIAAWYGEREDNLGVSNWYNFSPTEQVQGYCGTDEVAAFLSKVAAFKSEDSTFRTVQLTDA
tara:strand:- start:130 stop:456 length:327 start_codon:yes stop_codon:yes gene_type:complete